MSAPLSLLLAALPAAERPAIRAALTRVLHDRPTADDLADHLAPPPARDAPRSAAPPPLAVDLILALDARLVDLDRHLTHHLDLVLHHPVLRAVEARWRALRHLVDHLPAGAAVRVELLACQKPELAGDLDAAPDLERSGLGRLLHARALGTHGGVPYALVCADLEIGPEPADARLLRRLAALAALAHTVLLADAAPALLGVDAFADLAHLADLDALRDDPRLAPLRDVQRLGAARHLGLCLPRVLLRAPYSHHDPDLPFRYDESTRSDDDLLWGHAAPLVALRAIDAFARTGWCVHLLGWHGGGTPPPAAPSPSPLAWPPLPVPVDLLVSRHLAHALAQHGLIALVFDRARQRLALPVAPSLRAGHLAGRALDDHLPYTLLITRVAHYLRQIQREQIGLWDDLSALQRALDAWLRRHSADLPDPHPDTRARRPLRRAHVRLDPAQDGWIRCHIDVEPHLTHHGAPIALSLIARLDRPA